MLELSEKRFKPLEVGQTVRLPVADVDRAKTDARNILGIVVEKHDDFYKIGAKHGKLIQLFERNQLEPTSESFMKLDEVPNVEVRSVRTVAT
uniref:Uncharacterized protein n=1 Tax=Panagrolaimus sp. ES5 TaxID=591445 RepID=A0AC34G5S3_9BILA